LEKGGKGVFRAGRKIVPSYNAGKKFNINGEEGRQGIRRRKACLFERGEPFFSPFPGRKEQHSSTLQIGSVKSPRRRGEKRNPGKNPISQKVQALRERKTALRYLHWAPAFYYPLPMRKGHRPPGIRRGETPFKNGGRKLFWGGGASLTGRRGKNRAGLLIWTLRMG